MTWETWIGVVALIWVAFTLIIRWINRSEECINKDREEKG